MANKMLLIGKLEDGDKNLQPMSFIHPKYEKECCYLIGKNIYEMQTFEDDDHCSLFIDNFVQENNKIYIINQMDPMYLLIPLLLKNRQPSDTDNKFCSSPLNQLLTNNEITHILNKLPSPNVALKQICEVQEIDEDLYCVLDDDKVIQFLDKKLNQIQITLNDNISIPTNIDSLNDALCILNEYIPNYFFEKLCQKYSLSAKRVSNPRKRKLNVDNDIENENHDNKKRRMDDMIRRDEDGDNIMSHNRNIRDNFNNKNIKPKQSASKSRAIQKLAKVNTKGMKSMMSYFSKKK
eukprot:423528_1